MMVKDLLLFGVPGADFHLFSCQKICERYVKWVENWPLRLKGGRIW